MKKVIELRNIKLRTGPKKGSSVTLNFGFCVKFKEIFTKSRGEILEQSMAISAELNHFFDALNVEITDSKPGEGCMEKWKAFRATIHSHLPQLKSSTKDLRGNVHKAIGLRDKYAHADLGFTNNQPEITYVKKERGESRTVTEPINEKSLEDDLEFMEMVKEELGELNLTARKINE